MNSHRLAFPLVLAALSALLIALPAAAEDELFVVNAGRNAVDVFSRTASGGAAPLGTLIGPATGLAQPRRLALDPVNGEMLVTNVGTNSVTVYSQTASGNIAPLRTLSGAA